MTGSTGGAVPTERMQLVTFRVGVDLFATDIFAVERVLRFAPPRPIPNLPVWVEGVIEYGGRVVPVIDLRARFELPPATSREFSRILIMLVSADEWIAAIVDSVEEVTTVTAEQLAAPPPLFRGLAGQYLRALVRPADESGPVVVLLDVARLLTSRERIVLDQAIAGASARG